MSCARCLTRQLLLGNGGWLNGAAYGRWRSAIRSRFEGHLPGSSRCKRGKSCSDDSRLGIPTTPPPPSDRDLLAFVMKAHSEVGIHGLSITAYRRWQPAQEKAPTSGALADRFGSWSVILECCGYPYREREPADSDSEMLAALRNAAGTVGVQLEALTMQVYEEWRRGRRVPTVLTITNRFGSWPKAVGREVTAVARLLDPEEAKANSGNQSVKES